ncbi:MAG: hypothetical protein QOE68_3528, partial [Thermoanaerobaculia bacterium]|nr:hypothetical protein [Thermoanaerobaculia bacterium]
MHVAQTLLSVLVKLGTTEKINRFVFNTAICVSRFVILRLPEPGIAKRRNGAGRRRISSFPNCVESQWV